MEKFFCKPCNKQMYCQQYYDNHVNGYLHKEMVEGKQPSITQFYCTPCNKQMYCQSYYDNHIKGYEHMINTSEPSSNQGPS